MSNSRILDFHNVYTEYVGCLKDEEKNSPSITFPSITFVLSAARHYPFAGLSSPVMKLDLDDEDVAILYRKYSSRLRQELEKELEKVNKKYEGIT